MTVTLKCHTHKLIFVTKFTDEQHTTINQSTAGRFNPRVFVNCLQVYKRNYKPLQYQIDFCQLTTYVCTYTCKYVCGTHIRMYVCRLPIRSCVHVQVAFSCVSVHALRAVSDPSFLCTLSEALRRLFLPVAALGVLPSIFEATAIFLVTCWWTYNGRWEIALEQG